MLRKEVSEMLSENLGGHRPGLNLVTNTRFRLGPSIFPADSNSEVHLTSLGQADERRCFSAEGAHTPQDKASP